MNISDSSSGSSSATTTSSLSSSGPSFRPHHRWAVIGGELSRDRGNRLWLVDSDLIYRRLMDVVFSAASLPADSPVNTDPGAKQQIQVMTRLWREGGLVNCNEIPLGSSESGAGGFLKELFLFCLFSWFNLTVWQLLAHKFWHWHSKLILPLPPWHVTPTYCLGSEIYFLFWAASEEFVPAAAALPLHVFQKRELLSKLRRSKLPTWGKKVY